jgi:hypothetical protein
MLPRDLPYIYKCILANRELKKTLELLGKVI